MHKKKVLIAAGGTGGHVYPAASLGKELLEHGVEVKFVGGNLSRNKYFDRNQFSFEEITCGFLSTKNPFKLLLGMFRVGKGIWEGKRIINEFRPDIVVGFGSFYTFPVLSAAKFASLPIILHEQNAMPGRVNRLLSPYVALTAISMPDASKHLSGKTALVEMPLKLKNHPSKRESLAYFGLDSTKKTVLIFGGSQGSGAINQAILKSDLKDFQIIHFTGNPEMTSQAEEIYRQNQIPACVKDFETRMDYAWTAADMAVTRSGASTIAEAIEYGVPLIMIPFEKAMDNHQEKNADFMMRCGGGIKILEKNLTSELLASKIASLPLETYRQSIAICRDGSSKQSLASLVLGF